MFSNQISNAFTYHAPFGNQSERYCKIRKAAKDFADLIDNSCPDSQEKALAFTNLQQSVMWANASIAINEKDPSVR